MRSSTGTENGARVEITAGMISWADLTLVMEKKHRSRIQENLVIPSKINLYSF
ncbi:MAG: hypothetical protein U5N85_12020 [Arcicella sp.]|nr:hypothetical protein [Arcicella sp.]